jgi:hypothetical protein
MATSVVERRIDEWKQKLIDPSRRNRLIYFRPSKSSTLIIITPAAETVFNRLVVQEKSWKFWLPPEERSQKDKTQDKLSTTNARRVQIPSLPKSDPKQDELVCDGVTRTTLERALKNIFRKAHTDYQERGVRILYLAFGTLIWNDREQSAQSRSPLVLCPVDLRRESAQAPYCCGQEKTDT